MVQPNDEVVESTFFASVRSRLPKYPKDATSIQQAFGAGLPGEHLLLLAHVCSKMNATWLEQDWAVVTTHRCGFGKPGGALKGGYSLAWPRQAVASIGFGESHHFEQYGLRTEHRTFVSITIGLTDGQQYTRHRYLGSNETAINQTFPRLSHMINLVIRNGWPVVDGPAWNSSGGYSIGFGLGVGLWREV